jgi:hypothetical protein
LKHSEVGMVRPAQQQFIDATMKVLGTEADEVLVEQAKPLRNNAGPNEGPFVTQFNDAFDQSAETGSRSGVA